MVLPSSAGQPFSKADYKKNGFGEKQKHVSGFGEVAEQFGIAELLNRWVVIPETGLELLQFTGYLTLIEYVGIAYIANFSLQRINEAASLRADCLLWENDPLLGRVPILRGETTKTERDSDARWPTSPSVAIAVDRMNSIARLRIVCAAAHPKIGPQEAEVLNPYLFDRAFEPWAGEEVYPYAVRRQVQSYSTVVNNFPRLFDVEQLVITNDDLRIARMLTPGLRADRGFVVGNVWPLAWHQLRRTGAVNMFASGLLSNSSMQFLMKHSSRLMPLYYGRGYSKLLLNHEVENLIASSMYEAMAHSLLSAVGERFVSPHAEVRKQAIVVNLVGDKDATALAKAARGGKTFFREMRLGACTNRGMCSYGGIESIARCAGGDGAAPCADVLYDRLSSRRRRGVGSTQR